MQTAAESYSEQSNQRMQQQFYRKAWNRHSPSTAKRYRIGKHPIVISKCATTRQEKNVMEHRTRTPRVRPLRATALTAASEDTEVMIVDPHDATRYHRATTEISANRTPIKAHHSIKTPDLDPAAFVDRKQTTHGPDA